MFWSFFDDLEDDESDTRKDCKKDSKKKDDQKDCKKDSVFLRKVCKNSIFCMYTTRKTP